MLFQIIGPTGILNQTSPSADMVRLYVNVQFQVKPLSTGTSSSRTKKIFSIKVFVIDVNVLFQVKPLSTDTSSSQTKK